MDGSLYAWMLQRNCYRFHLPGNTPANLMGEPEIFDLAGITPIKSTILRHYTLKCLISWRNSSSLPTGGSKYYIRRRISRYLNWL